MNNQTECLKQALEQIAENKMETLDLFLDLIIERQIINENILPEEVREKEALILKSIKDVIINCDQRDGLNQQTYTLDITVSD